MDRLKALEILKTVAEQGSFTKAADALRLGVPSISRTIQCLETSLGVLLFHRTTRKVTLTHVGHDVLEQAIALLAQYEHFSVCCHTNASDVQGDVSIEVSNLFGADRLVPVLADFNRRYPLVRNRVDWVDHPSAAFSGAADLSIVTERTSSVTCVERRLGRIAMGLYASPRFRAAAGAPDDPQALERTDAHGGKPGSGASMWPLRHRRTGATAAIRLAGAIRSNCLDTLILATTRGAGFAVLPEHLARPLERAGELVRLLPDWQVGDLDASLLYHSRRNLPARVRTLAEHLVAAFDGGRDPRPATRHHARAVTHAADADREVAA
ncbi:MULTISPECIES: LysR family transcriptional regulator [unclassified Burkholderia]|uniref:LysR family transcriptional regulator n=1 Tax=unclassified Burkholderia TaxID=2613784 RepID=UPI000F56579E|nr:MULTISPECIES: LysR family transcriptional regulator [unclassified Burkholderia]RQR35804.1 LysR family transcriptional regulator [Burkholderia sp. Bp9131]RQR63519.1 LysR family transcriptional regulator [Burkholderia sp. Bp9015]RQS04230.1 LysR family transcriptional regulator [Burkholderia sp. Bp8991]RQS29743.1 LysR family transcriptional regulator [Burkholderia sp. Bp8995]RQS47839.1 LysR family transcriptional regulator [Burkholderia sp. Bp8989]